MAAALSEVWKVALHLWCKWHVFKDAKTQLGPIYKKGSAFRKEFHKIIHDMMTVEEFERAWGQMLDRFKLRNNEYLANIYRKREKWAKAFFSDAFCARMTSTQRSSANHMLKRFVPRNCSMNRFIEQFNKLLFDRNSVEDTAEFATKIVHNVSRRAWPIEEHAMTFYTAAVFKLFSKEVYKSTHNFAVETIKNKEWEVVHVKPQKKLPWSSDKFVVLVKNEGESYECQCGLYQHFGILCSHVLRVLLQLGIHEIPDAHIMKRWTRSARDVLPGELKFYQQDTLCAESMTFRHSFLYVNAMGVVQQGNKDLGAFDIASKYLKKAQRKLAQYYKDKEASSTNVARATPGFDVQGNYYTTDSEAYMESGTEAEVRHGNSYGAAGSCAGMSDSELLGIRGPDFRRPPGRPRATRFKGHMDVGKKRQSKKRRTEAGISYNTPDSRANVDNNPKRKKMRCGDCELYGHNSANCRKKQVDLDTEVPEF